MEIEFLKGIVRLMLLGKKYEHTTVSASQSEKTQGRNHAIQVLCRGIPLNILTARCQQAARPMLRNLLSSKYVEDSTHLDLKSHCGNFERSAAEDVASDFYQPVVQFGDPRTVSITKGKRPTS